MTAPYPQVVLFGDSLIQGAAGILDSFSLQAALQSHCMRRYDVVNRGLSGYNSSHALKALPSIFPLPPAGPSPFTPKIAYLVILFGANDAALPASRESQHVDLADYEANLRAILTHPNIQAHSPGKILVVTPPPVDAIRLGEYERLNGQTTPTSRTPRVSAEYSAAARRVAQSVPNVAVVDLWKALMDRAVARTPGFDPAAGIMLGDQDGGVRGYLAQLLTDGLHLSGEGYRVFFEELRPHIMPQNPRETMEGWAYPDWRKAPWAEK